MGVRGVLGIADRTDRNIVLEFEDENEDDYEATQPTVVNANDTADVSTDQSRRRRAH